MLTGLRAPARPSHMVTREHGWAPRWNESSQPSQPHCMPLGVADLCSLMTDLISEHSLVPWSWPSRIGDTERSVTQLGGESCEGHVRRPALGCGPPMALKALSKEAAAAFTPAAGNMSILGVSAASWGHMWEVAFV